MTNKNNRLLFILFSLFTLIAGALVLLPAGCGESRDPAELADQESVQKQQLQYQAVQPIPFFEFSEERDAAEQIYRARNENVNTWTVWRSDTGVVEGWCASVGYPLPYDTSFTNPLQPMKVWSHSAANAVAVGQAEPNGLFASQNSIATWVRCLHGERVVPTYVESKVTAYAIPIKVEGNLVTVVEDAEPSVVLKNRKPGKK